MILAICCTWARIKRVISVDDWFLGMILALAEIGMETGLLMVVML